MKLALDWFMAREDLRAVGLGMMNPNSLPRWLRGLARDSVLDSGRGK